MAQRDSDLIAFKEWPEVLARPCRNLETPSKLHIANLLNNFGTGIDRFWKHRPSGMVRQLNGVYADFAKALETLAGEDVPQLKRLFETFVQSAFFLNDEHCSVLKGNAVRDRVSVMLGWLLDVRHALFTNIATSEHPALLVDFVFCAFTTARKLNNMMFLSLAPEATFDALGRSMQEFVQDLARQTTGEEKRAQLDSLKRHSTYGNALADASQAAFRALLNAEASSMPVWVAINRLVLFAHEQKEGRSTRSTAGEDIKAEIDEVFKWVGTYGWRDWKDWKLFLQDDVAKRLNELLALLKRAKTKERQLRDIAALYHDEAFLLLLETGKLHSSVAQLLYACSRTGNQGLVREFDRWLSAEVAVADHWHRQDRQHVTAEMTRLIEDLKQREPAQMVGVLRNAKLANHSLAKALAAANATLKHDTTTGRPGQAAYDVLRPNELGQVSLSPRQTEVYRQTHAAGRRF